MIYLVKDDNKKCVSLSGNTVECMALALDYAIEKCQILDINIVEESKE